MKVTEIETGKSTKHQKQDGCLQKNTAEQEGYGEALIEEQMAEKNINTTSNRI